MMEENRSWKVQREILYREINNFVCKEYTGIETRRIHRQMSGIISVSLFV